MVGIVLQDVQASSSLLFNTPEVIAGCNVGEGKTEWLWRTSVGKKGKSYSLTEVRSERATALQLGSCIRWLSTLIGKEIFLLLRGSRAEAKEKSGEDNAALTHSSLRPLCSSLHFDYWHDIPLQMATDIFLPKHHLLKCLRTPPEPLTTFILYWFGAFKLYFIPTILQL